ncbi:hypothetical protein Mgra_00001566 [Meloidogyne graminicola]|uniref:Carbonyl reductase n=1 Tax=Meloidogyne graminicola TaxID=189291 RepID=A0A8T0A153_9BILA|nr:hypothetical protein Mgra_00001566 [Meloidogyne graminicola]
MNGKIFVVTGANKGIGYGIVRGLAKQLNGSIIYLTARNSSLGQTALHNLEKELGDKKINNKIIFHQLDITNEDSCNNFADYLRKSHKGIDVLINNAGFAFKNNATENPSIQADITIGINYYGTKLISNYLIPLINKGGRIVNVCSQGGIMNGNYYKYKKELVDIFRNPFTEADIDKFVEDYKKFAKEDKRREGGYPEAAYGVSKAAEIALSLLQANELKTKGIIVNACCPGYVNTDMTSHKGHLTIDEGADTPIWLATAEDIPNGKFVYLRKPIEWLY